MDALLAKLGAQAVNYAIRSGIAITSTYAVHQCSRLLKTVDDKVIHAQLKSLQKVLDSKIKILAPAIDLIEFKSGRGNVFLESAVPLAKSLHRDIISLGNRLNDAAAAEEASRLAGRKTSRMSETHHAALMLIIGDIKSLLARIDRDIPLIQLAITASGESMANTLPTGISPSRLMQASTFLSFADAQFTSDPRRPVQVGPSFTLSLYMLFRGHSKVSSSSQPDKGENGTPTTAPKTPERLAGSRKQKEEPYGLGEGDRKPIWQEVMHKARVRLCRTPLGWVFDCTQGYCPGVLAGLGLKGDLSAESAVAMIGRPDEYAYHLEVIEDLDDGRHHEEDGKEHGPFDDIAMAGIKESIPIHQVSKIFYTDTGRLLNIKNENDGDNNPVLLLKRDAHAPTPSRLREQWAEEPNEEEADIADRFSLSDDQAEVDRQLREEARNVLGLSSQSQKSQKKPRERAKMGNLPQHLDPEWLALEVYMEDNNDDDESEDESERLSIGDGGEGGTSTAVKRLSFGGWPKTERRDRSSVDAKLLAQIQNISIRSTPPPESRTDITRSAPGSLEKEKAQTEPSPESHVAKSPFGTIVSSLSLLEMLVRLTSLQEFQQTSHLSIPDHILTFFLEETSTTGLHGEARWEARNEAKRRVGFDPYTDTPTK
ncbi:RanGTP-binding protein-domain-containing protein [Diplogelasinospora grovesii]|uniref:RanGTP-binding protein-domain-containing protein n=1 Tax=Diplogelasinospora grovesii TaxID=303347 RepID=A0AAN6S9P0_9PEZI|nr:RanGTP-binding protein-domain-containing protein [Diplogelasinospora grovesii]